MRSKEVKYISAEVEESLFAKIERWRRAQKEIPSRSEALRALLQMALGSDQKVVKSA